MECWYWGRRGLNGIQEVALRIVPRLRGILSVLWPSLSRRLSKIVPQPILFAEVDFGHPPNDLGSSVPLGPLLYRVGVVERIAHFRHTICTVCNIERRIGFLEVLR